MEFSYDNGNTGYKAYLISTIVDRKFFKNSLFLGYKAYLISTIVDRCSNMETTERAIKLISTIVDFH